MRVEHWANANDSGLAAGRSMAGVDVTYDPVPFFFSDQYDAGLEYAGYVPKDADSELVVRGDTAGNEFMAFWVVPDGDGVRVLAGMHVNVWDTIDAVQALIRKAHGCVPRAARRPLRPAGGPGVRLTPVVTVATRPAPRYRSTGSRADEAVAMRDEAVARGRGGSALGCAPHGADDLAADPDDLVPEGG